MPLLEKCREEIQTLKPDSCFVKMYERCAWHFYDYHSESVLRGRVEMVLASVLHKLVRSVADWVLCAGFTDELQREMFPRIPELCLRPIKLRYWQETTNTLWYGKVDYSIGF